MGRTFAAAMPDRGSGLRAVGRMTTRALRPFFTIAFGVGWGLAALVVLIPQLETVFGPVGYTNPLFILAVWPPGIAGTALVPSGGVASCLTGRPTHGRRRSCRCVLPTWAARRAGSPGHRWLMPVR